MFGKWIFVLASLVSFHCISAMPSESSIATGSEANETTFLYFGFGSNLLEKRIHIQNPSARRRNPGVGELRNYRLDFHLNSERWNGSPATVVEDDGESVWGALWEINLEHMNSLDKQEGVDTGIYRPMMLPIYVTETETVEARVYQLVNNAPRVKVDSPYKPSQTYLNVILKGAEETGLPQYYIDKLKAIEHNGRIASGMVEHLNNSQSTTTQEPDEVEGVYE